MRIKVFFEKENVSKGVDIPKGHSIESLLKKLKINPQTVIVSKNGEVVTEQEILDDRDELRIFSVKLGG